MLSATFELISFVYFLKLCDALADRSSPIYVLDEVVIRGFDLVLLTFIFINYKF